MANIIETLKQEQLYETFLRALQQAGLEEMLRQSGPYTVFAPNEAAFAKLPPGVVDELMNDTERLRKIVLYHIVDGDFMFDDLEDNEFLGTLEGEPVGIDFNSGVMVNIATMMEMDIEADNGVIHSIDTVLLPKSEAKVYG